MYANHYHLIHAPNFFLLRKTKRTEKLVNVSKILNSTGFKKFKDIVQWGPISSTFPSRGIYTNEVGAVEVECSPIGCLVYATDDLWIAYKSIYNKMQKEMEFYLRAMLEKPSVRNISLPIKWSTIKDGSLVDNPKMTNKESLYPSMGFSGHNILIPLAKSLERQTYDDYLNELFSNKLSDEQKQKALIDLVKLLDLLVAIPWVLLDQDPLTSKRAELLCPASSFSIEEKSNSKGSIKYLRYGTLSPAPMWAPQLAWLAAGMVREAATIVSCAHKENYTKNSSTYEIYDENELSLTEWQKLLKDIFKVAPADEVVDIINKNDFVGAYDIWKRLCPIQNRISTGDTIWGVGAGRKAFEATILMGGVRSIGKSFEGNWKLSTPMQAYSTHGSTLKAWETWAYDDGDFYAPPEDTSAKSIYKISKERLDTLLSTE